MVGMSSRVASVMGKKVANTGPICSCTIFTSTNWLAQIRWQISTRLHARKRVIDNTLPPPGRTDTPSAIGRILQLADNCPTNR
jgi:hypothetical protein